MSNVPGVTVTKPVEVKSSGQSKTVWTIIATALITVVTNLFPQIKEALTPEVVNSIITIGAALAGIFLRKSVEDTKKAAAGAPVVKQ